ncbi:hypothetical protein K8I28_13505 [bacterium]|nr:hypothetical protein [bacterium]
MPSAFVDLIDKEDLQLVFVPHAETIELGPFTFPPEAPVPVANKSNLFVRTHWLEFPYSARGQVSSYPDEEGLDDFDPRELITAFQEGHLPATSPDAHQLVDHVGRSLLMFLTFSEDDEMINLLMPILAESREAEPIYDLLVTIGNRQIQEGTTQLESGNLEIGWTSYILGRIMLTGAHYISPTSAGVLFNLGLLTFDSAHRFRVDDEELSERKKQEFTRESIYFLQLALADEDIRTSTPAFYLLGINRELIGESENSKNAFQRFLDATENRFPQIRDEVLKRMNS